MATSVVVVESPAKAKTINKYLGKGYEVLASYGHVRDLPSKDGSVDPEADFAMTWEVEGRGAKQISEIAKALKDADRLILATDPDREGEAISWHLLEALRQRRAVKDKPVSRVTFNAITRDAVAEAMANPRDIDQALVEAYLARRALDYLVGFTLSPVLWRKLPGARSAGRVQSVALRLVCEREAQIERFVAQEYWSLVATLRTPRNDAFEARLVGADGKKLTRLSVGTAQEADAFRKALEAARFTVADIEAKPVKRHPSPPFTTSTLQQEASRKLGLSPSVTMRLAQKLYEGIDIGGDTVGLITYMRTDAVQVSGEGLAQIRRYIGHAHAPEYLPGVPRAYATKAKNAQEAHEAIRPTDVFRRPSDLKRHLDGDSFRLYDLIWKRTVASQMESALLNRTTVDIVALVGGAGPNTLDLRATGQVVSFDGFLTLYSEGKDDEEDEENRRLPAMAKGEALAREKIAATQHFTEPPPRFTEASLVKRMEELGIGRPSTYAATMGVLRDREYVRLDKNRLVPEDKGRLVTAFLESFFGRYVEYDFTADLENELDRISNHEVDWKDVLRAFWRDFIAKVDETKTLRTSAVLDALNELLGPAIFPERDEGGDPRACPRCGAGRLSLKLGKLGPFVGCSNYPECRFTRPLSATGGEGEAGENGIVELGQDASSGLMVSVRNGRFGPYVQLGDGEKPKRQTIPKGLKPAELALETALRLLSLPREVARHPESGEPILAGIGRYGAYVQHGKTYANLGKDDDVLEIGANRAIDLIIAKEQGGPGGRRGGGAPAGTVLGEHPDGGPVTVRAGRYGPYVNWGKINATLPKGVEPDALDLAAALGLITAKAGTAPAKGARSGKGAATSKSKSARTTATSAKSNPNPAPAKSKPAPAKSKPAAAKSKPAAAKSKPAAAKSKPASGTEDAAGKAKRSRKAAAP